MGTVTGKRGDPEERWLTALYEKADLSLGLLPFAL